mgnify:CR=1 FL=1
MPIFQSTPSQEGEPPARIEELKTQKDISIHSLARGRTDTWGGYVEHTEFQSTPSQEGERNRNRHFCRRNRFQSTPSQEGEQKRQASNKKKKGISIHSLARGRTGTLPTGFVTVINFNPLPRKRENGKKHIVSRCDSLFQSTPSQEGELKQNIRAVPKRSFQSTPSQEGELGGACAASADYHISIHSLARGRTTQGGSRLMSVLLFQSTPSQEGEPNLEAIRYLK